MKRHLLTRWRGYLLRAWCIALVALMGWGATATATPMASVRPEVRGQVPAQKSIASVAGLGEILYPASGNCGSITVRSKGSAVEWSLESGKNYSQGEVAANREANVSIPRGTTFTLTIARPAAKRMGWVHVMESNCRLAVIASSGPGTAVTLGSGSTLLNVSGLGNVVATGKGTALTLRNTGRGAMEWSLESGGKISGGEIAAGGSGTVSIPHYKTFTLTIANPEAGQIGALHCRENNNVVLCTAGSGPVSARLGSRATLLDVARTGKVTATGSGTSLTIASSGPAVQWSIDSGDSYQGGQVAAGRSQAVTIPHKKTFNLTIANPSTGAIGSLRCRENKNAIACLKGSP